jgi:hypothetical protein
MFKYIRKFPYIALDSKILKQEFSMANGPDKLSPAGEIMDEYALQV